MLIVLHNNKIGIRLLVQITGVTGCSMEWDLKEIKEHKEIEASGPNVPIEKSSINTNTNTLINNMNNICFLLASFPTNSKHI